MKTLMITIVCLAIALGVVFGLSAVAQTYHAHSVAQAEAAKAAMAVRKDALNALTGKQRRVLRLTVQATMGSMVRDDESCAMTIVAQAVGSTKLQGTHREVYAGCGYTSDDYLAFGIVGKAVKREWKKQLIAANQR
jgi:hypothetical protein